MLINFMGRFKNWWYNSIYSVILRNYFKLFIIILEFLLHAIKDAQINALREILKFALNAPLLYNSYKMDFV